MNIAYAFNCIIQREGLAKLSVEQLKALWDQYDGINSPGGFWGEEIHRELNQRGAGDYCAV